MKNQNLVNTLTVATDDSRACAIADSNYAAGMLTGWNLCVAEDEVGFNRIRGDRLRAAAQASRNAKAQDSAPQPAETVSTHHVHRGTESLPCYCKGKDDHPIGKETREPANTEQEHLK